MSSRARMRRTAVVVVVLATVVGVTWYVRSAHKRHVTGLIDEAFVTIGIDPADAAYFNYFTRNLGSACLQRPPDERRIGARAAREDFAPIDHLEAAAVLADHYESDGWTVRRWLRPSTEGSGEIRAVEAHRGGDQVLAVIQDGAIAISVNSGPCLADLAPPEVFPRSERVDSFG